MSKRKVDNSTERENTKKEYSKKVSGKGRKNYRSKKASRNDDSEEERSSNRRSEGLIPMKNGDRNPNWYFTDKAMAEQVTQLSFQNLAGYPITVDGKQFDVPNVVTIFMNPSPGVIKSADYGSTLINKTNGVNLSGFRTFSELAAYTGRSAIYGPQDISTMILGLGEIISIMEVIRRAFGVAFTMNMRNRSYPRTILEAMRIDPDDLFTNFSDYRTRYNTLITMFNQIPIPADVAYFDKCLRIYQELYLDSDSAMAQTLIPMPWSTWVLDEQSYSGGTILATEPVCCQTNKTSVLSTIQPLSYFLNIADKMIGAMLNSSTLNVVYTDLLNLASKKNVTFLKLDYLAEGYCVVPRFSQEFMLQMHNSTLVGPPACGVLLTNPHVTPFNDVYPNANTNTLYYNPGFWPFAEKFPRTGREVIVDMLTDSPDLVDRIEVLRYTSIAASNEFVHNVVRYVCDATTPDHYVVGVHFWTPSLELNPSDFYNMTNIEESVWKRLSSLVSNIDWAPRFYEVHLDAAGPNSYYTGNYTGDVNFYTVVSEEWLRKVNQFIALDLYRLR